LTPNEKVSAGIIVKAMILNGLGFVSYMENTLKKQAQKQKKWKRLKSLMDTPEIIGLI
jgi:hypothetical protein